MISASVVIAFEAIAIHLKRDMRATAIVVQIAWRSRHVGASVMVIQIDCRRRDGTGHIDMFTLRVAIDSTTSALPCNASSDIGDTSSKAMIHLLSQEA